MSTPLKNTLASAFLNYFADAKEESLAYMAELATIEKDDDNNEELKSRLNDLDKTFPFSSTKNYFVAKLANYVNRKPVFAILLVVGILYNVVFYAVKLMQAIIH